MKFQCEVANLRLNIELIKDPCKNANYNVFVIGKLGCQTS